MTNAQKYLDLLREREPRQWSSAPEKSPLTEQDLEVVEKGLGYTLPVPYREFLLTYKMPSDLTALVSFCGDSFACSWDKTFSREQNCYVPRPDNDIGPTMEFEWHNIEGNSGAEFLANLQKEQKTQKECPCFLEAGFIRLGEVWGYLTYLDLVNGSVVAIHEEGIYDMMLTYGVVWNDREGVRRHMESELCICKNFNDFLRFVCTGDFLDEDEAYFPTEEELKRDYTY